MTLKPSKKSDLNKQWMQPRKDRARKMQPQRHLIISEGTNTEPAYFKAIKETINNKYREKYSLILSVKVTIPLIYFVKQSGERSRILILILMSGLFMILTISLRNM